MPVTASYSHTFNNLLYSCPRDVTPPAAQTPNSKRTQSHFRTLLDVFAPPVFWAKSPRLRVSASNRFYASSPPATMELTPKMDSSKVDLKQTINLPKTDFSMKANLPQ